MLGVPARQAGWVCECGAVLHVDGGRAACAACGRTYAKTEENKIEEH